MSTESNFELGNSILRFLTGESAPCRPNVSGYGQESHRKISKGLLQHRTG